MQTGRHNLSTQSSKRKYKTKGSERQEIKRIRAIKAKKILSLSHCKVPKQINICRTSHVCDKGVKVALACPSPHVSHPVSLSVSSVPQSVSKLSQSYLMVFIYPFHVGF